MRPAIQRLEALIANLRQASEGISAFARAWQAADEGGDVITLFNLSGDLDIIAHDLDEWTETA
jgi:hypothetical protein